MRGAYDVEQVRQAEAALAATLPPGTLMDRAATGIATGCRALLGRVYGARVVLLVGSGDNGGDALFAGAALARRGARVDAVLLGPRAHDGGLRALLAAGGCVVAPGQAREAAPLIGRADLVLDGILGIGGAGGLRPDAEELVGRVEASRAVLVSVDVPSGIDASTGEVAGCAVHADVTLTPGAWKPGLLVDPGASHAGIVHVIDIGLAGHLPQPDVEVLEDGDVARLLPRPGPESDKYRRGVVAVVAGSDTYPGAAVLCSGAALHSGSGMVRYVGPAGATAAVLARWPEVVAGDGRVQARVVGPGIAEPDAVAAHVAQPEPAVLDAACTTLHARARGPLLLTPHAGELATLLGAERSDIEARRLHWAREAARVTGATVLLKGSTTIVAAPGGPVRLNPTGTPWLATAGSGDVLAGLAGALLAGGLSPYDAGSVAAWLHGLAGRAASGGGPTTSADVLAALPDVMRAALTGRGPERFLP